VKKMDFTEKNNDVHAKKYVDVIVLKIYNKAVIKT
jgi:hypothetical protein